MVKVKKSPVWEIFFSQSTHRLTRFASFERGFQLPLAVVFICVKIKFKIRRNIINDKIKEFINGIDEVSNYTLIGASQFSEVTKLTFVKNFLEKVFQYTNTNDTITDSVTFHDFVSGHVVIFTNEIKHDVITITINDKNVLTSVTLNRI